MMIIFVNLQKIEILVYLHSYLYLFYDMSTKYVRNANKPVELESEKIVKVIFLHKMVRKIIWNEMYVLQIYEKLGVVVKKRHIGTKNMFFAYKKINSDFTGKNLDWEMQA